MLVSSGVHCEQSIAAVHTGSEYMSRSALWSGAGPDVSTARSEIPLVPREPPLRVPRGREVG